MPVIKGKVYTFDLSHGLGTGRKYIVTSIPYHIFRQYFHKDVYDPFSGTGEQRVAGQRKIAKMVKEISNGNYTPTIFNAGIPDGLEVKIDQGNVEIPLNENNPKFVILDGGTRFDALEQIRSSNELSTRLVDALPIPLIVYLDDRHKSDFINLQAGTPVSRSHLLAMSIDTEIVPNKDLSTLTRAQKIAKLLHTTEGNPFYELVSFGQEEGGSLAFNVLATMRKGSLSHSLCGASKILMSINQPINMWYVNLLKDVYEFAQQVGVTEKGLLLCLPPNGPKGAANLLIGATNVWAYYLYMHELDAPRQIDIDLLNDALLTFNESVGGSFTAQRTQTLMCEFAQQLFVRACKSNPEKFLAGIPQGLIVTTSDSSFALTMCKDNRLKPKEVVDEVVGLVADTDTDPSFLENS